MIKQIKLQWVFAGIGATLSGFSSIGLCSPAPTPNAEEALGAPAAQLELLWSGGMWLESPAVSPEGEVFFSDIREVIDPAKLGVIRVYNPRSKKTRLFRSPSFGSNGLIFDPTGRLLAAHGANFGGRYITTTDLKTGLSEVLVGKFENRALNSPNDMALDAYGRLYFTDPRYGGHEPLAQPVMGVYRVDVDRSVHLIISDVSRPNGIAISGDGQFLYLTEVDPPRTIAPESATAPAPSGVVRILEYALSRDGRASNKRVLKTYDATKFSVDGIKTDEAGHIYVAEMSDNSGVRVLERSGKSVGFIAVPGKVTNLTIDDDALGRWIYITSATQLFRIRISPPG
jgi:gluconolactonase